MHGGDGYDDTYMDTIDEVEEWMVADPGPSSTSARARRRRKRRYRFLKAR